jgi:methylated-DNA-[protein]-cysteine S-methyltransferase
MPVKYISRHDSPVGVLRMIEHDGRIVRLSFESETISMEDVEVGETELARAAWLQLDEYFAGKRKSFDLPLLTAGTPFMTDVWAVLSRIPHGETRTYSEIAAAVGNPRACRAVGQAVNCNPIPILIPCHRVVGSSGALTGFRAGLPLKARLLEIEKQDANIPLHNG